MRARIKNRPLVELINLACFGRLSRLVWRKHRWRCLEPACPTGSYTHVDECIAAPQVAMTAGAARWATRQVGRLGRSVNEVAVDLGTPSMTLSAPTARRCSTRTTTGVGAGDALGLDETLFCRTGQWRTQQSCTSIVNFDADGAQLIHVVRSRSATTVLGWLDDQPNAWRHQIRWGVLDLSGPYRKGLHRRSRACSTPADPTGDLLDAITSR